jgi:hypothetical protein
MGMVCVGRLGITKDGLTEEQRKKVSLVIRKMLAGVYPYGPPEVVDRLILKMES